MRSTTARPVRCISCAWIGAISPRCWRLATQRTRSSRILCVGARTTREWDLYTVASTNLSSSLSSGRDQTPKQRSTRAISAATAQTCGGTRARDQLSANRRGRKSARAPSDGQAGRDDRGRHHGLYGEKGHRAGRIPRQRHQLDSSRAHVSAMLRTRTGSSLCRYDHSPMAGVHAGRRASRLTGKTFRDVEAEVEANGERQ